MVLYSAACPQKAEDRKKIIEDRPRFWWRWMCRRASRHLRLADAQPRCSGAQDVITERTFTLRPASSLSSYSGLLYMERGNVQEVRLTASVLMVVFGLPISFAFQLLLSFLVKQSAAISFLLDTERPLAFIAILVMFYLIGVFQWLVLVPMRVRRVRRVSP